jgi:excisionase family DNA binding protein
MDYKEKYPIVMTAKHVSEILGCSLRIAYEVMEQPDFPLIRIGRHKKVNREAFFRWLERSE